jgi:hypothetical protein
MKYLPLLLLVSCTKEKPPEPPPVAPCPPRIFNASRVATPIEVDGELEDDAWGVAMPSGTLKGARDEKAMVAHTEARAVWDDEALYVALYAADEDETSHDVMRLDLGDAALRVRVSPDGQVDCQPASACGGVEAKTMADGTLNDASDDDEEWEAELKIPWARLGGRPASREVPFDVVREDRPKSQKQDMLLRWSRCGKLVLIDPS